MRRKILSSLFIITSIFILVSCFYFPTNDDYIPQTNYEQTIISTTEELEKTTVTLITTTNNKGEVIQKDIVGSAVIVNKNENVYTAITTANIISSFENSLYVVTNKIGSKSAITRHVINEKYNIGIIQFTSNTLLTSANIVNDNGATYEHLIGQTIITLGTNLTNSSFNAAKVGMINNDELMHNEINDYGFMHDATNNPGDEGAGVFDLNGNLLGINSFTFNKTTTNPEQYILGMTITITSEVFANVINNFEQITFENTLLEDDFFLNDNNTTKYESEFNFEKNNIQLNKTLTNKTVTVVKGEDLASGLIYSRDEDSNNYWVITKSFEDFTKLNIYSHNQEKLTILDSYSFDKYYISIHKVTSENELSVYNSSAINEGIGFEINEGQKLFSIGTPISTKYAQTLNRATLSKTNFTEEIFMHDGNLNYGQSGAPLFNLNGDLVGFNMYKTNGIETTANNGETEKLLTEGLAYAVNINYVADAINYITKNNNNLPETYSFNKITEIKSYSSLYEEEKAIINLINKVMDKTVTVSTDNGHGSGVIFNKKKLIGKGYRYSVLTNYHVISNAIATDGEISIIFNDGNISVFAEDYVGTKQPHDVAILRFTSSVEHSVIDLDVINNKKGINPKKGQTLVAVGTPASRSLNGYVTVGNVTTPTSSSNGVNNLYINHNTAINPGNSGGPLFDLNGTLLGLNVSKTTFFGNSSNSIPAKGIGYSLNMNVLAPLINSYKSIDYRSVERKARLGITVSPLNEYIKNPNFDPNSIPNLTEGIIVVDIDERRESYGKINELDIITYVNGFRVTTNEDIAAQLHGKTFGDEISLTINRLVDGEPVVIVVVVKLS